MLSTILSVSALLFSFCILCLGHGLHNTILGVRATMEHYPEWITGLMMSGYFFGFIIGTFLCARLIPIVGQIRTFAAFASVASAISLLHVLFVNEITWIILRIIYGICIAALYMVIESWLNALANKKNRGRIFSVYMSLSFLGLALGQTLVFIGTPQEYALFAIVSVLISISLVPLTISKAQQPENVTSENFGIRRLFSISPLATIGCLATGLTLGSFWGLGAVSYTKIGFTHQDVAILIACCFAGGLLFQWPVGYCSDIFDRRITISVVLLLSVGVCIQMIIALNQNTGDITLGLILLSLLFGGFTYTLYSLFITLANDFLEPKFIVQASGGLITLHAIGAMFGPIIASLLMLVLGNSGLFVFIAAIHGATFIFAIIRIINGRTIPEATSDSYVSIPKTSMAIAELAPRQDDE